MLFKIKEKLQEKPSNPDKFRREGYVVLSILFAVIIVVLILAKPNGS